jgi:hypothetical protein
VPPVASRSSTTTTRSPAAIAADVHLDPVGAVLERVVVADRLVRQLARLAHRHEADPERGGQRRAEDEAAGVDRRDLVDPRAACSARPARRSTVCRRPRGS